MKKRNLSNLLKRRTRSYSAQAAATSIGIHLLLIIFAGSIVAVHYVQKQNAELIAHTESHPKLERQKLQTPARVDQLQKRALTSKLVSKKVSFANPEFVLPDTGKISSLKTQKTSLPGIDAGRILKNLSRTPGVGPSRINFFGIRAEGEKVCFVIDASAVMLDSSTGGQETYEYIKDELGRIVAGMKPTMLFNLIFYDQQRLFMFRSGLVPATKAMAGELSEWVKSVNSDAEQPGLNPDQNNYKPPVIYETALGEDAQGWLLAMQSAMEQKPDVILALGSGWGHHHISAEKANRLLDYAMWELLVGNIISGAQVLEPDRKLRDDLLKSASDAIQADEKEREAENRPEGFVRDVARYVEYSKDQILDHLEAVCKASYGPLGLPRPTVDFVCLTEAANQVVAGGTLNNMRAMTGRYTGQFDFLRREVPSVKTTESDTLQAANSPVAETAVPSVASVSYFGAEATGSRIAFILDASKEMLTDETGGAFSCNLIKEQIEKSVSALPDGVQFNVFLYNGRQLALFRPDMIPVDTNTMTELKAWLDPVDNDSAHPGLPNEIVSSVPIKDYGTMVGADASDWLLALQVALEQKADAVWIAGAGWGNPAVSREKGKKLLDFSVWDSWSGGGDSGASGGGEATSATDTGEDGTETAVTTSSSGSGAAALGTIAGLKQDKQQRDALLKEALKAIGQEDKIRKAKGLPQPFVRDILAYLRYTAPQIGEHLNAVIQDQSSVPTINFVCLMPAQGKPAVETVRNLRKLTTDHGGNFVLFRGTNNIDEIKKLNRDIELTK